MIVSADMRWWIFPPAPEETLRSILARAAALYQWEPQMLWRELNEGADEADSDVDSPSCSALLRLARALGVSAARLRDHRVSNVPWRLEASARRAVCPVCWESGEGRPEAQIELRSWTHVLRTQCPMHGVPLCLPAGRSHSGVRAHHVAALTTEDNAVLQLIERFGLVLERALFFGGPWPIEWRGSPKRVRQLLIDVTIPDEAAGYALIAMVSPSSGLEAFVRNGRHLPFGTPRRDWERFRRIADPAIRRAALWIAGWMTIPDLPQSMAPGWDMDFRRWFKEPNDGSSSSSVRI